jgi:PAS domain S-box-containing protein
VSEPILRVVVIADDEPSPALHGAVEAVLVPSHSDALDAALSGACEAVVLYEGSRRAAALRFLADMAEHAAGTPPVIVLLEDADPTHVARAGAAASLPRAAATPEVLATLVRHAVASRRARAGVSTVRNRAAPHEVIWEWDVATDRLLWMDALFAAFGYAPRDVGESLDWWAERVHPDEREAVVESLRAAARTGEPFWSALYRFRRANDSYVHVLDRGRALRDSSGRTVRVVGSIRPLAGRRRDDAGEEECGYLLDHVREAVLVLAEGVVMYANSATAHVLNVARPAELVGRLWADFLHPDDREGAAQRLRAVAAGARILPAHERLVRPDGVIVDVECTASPVEYAGEPGVVVVARDIRERLRLEEQLRLAQRMEAVGRLAGGVAHDFNNLLTTIKGNADLLAMDLPDGSASLEDVSEIQAATVRAAALTRHLLAFGRGQVLLPRVLDLNAEIEAALPMLRRLMPENVEIATELDPDTSPVHADPGQLEQVLMNLALNARDAMPDGGTLRLATANTDIAEPDPRPAYMAAGAYVRLRVTDTGHGMDAATRAQVFEPFFTTRGVGRGAGLGLSTVYGIVKQSGGYIMVESEPGHGTTFHILLPRVTEPGLTAGPGTPELAPATARGTVLLVEDEDPVRRVTARALRRRGFGVLEARDGREALDLWEEHGAAVDMVLTDLVMPRIGGEELARRLLEAHPGLPILFMTGYTSGAALSRGPLAPGAEVVHKPFDADALAERIARMLERD